MASKKRLSLHDVLTATRHGCTVADLGARRFPNAERHLKAPAEMRDLFADFPDAVARTETAEEYTAGKRLYGSVEGDLLYAYDVAARGEGLQPRLWARLKRA